MLEADKSIWFEKVFAVYNRNLLKRRFNSLQVAGLDSLIEKNKNFPLLLYVNHSSWWDGLVVFQISHHAKLQTYVLMEEKQLRKLSLFRKLGAFSVVREKPRQAMESINYAAKILQKNPKNAVWIFPQGEILPNDIRPLVFYGGLSKIIEKAENCCAVPVAIRYEFLGKFKPDIFVEIGEPDTFETKENHSSKQSKSTFEKKLTFCLDNLKRELLEQNYQHFEKLL